MATARPARILGLGTFVPERVLTNEDLAKMVDTSDAWIVERTGIRERRVSPPETRNSTLAMEAARRALADARLDARAVDLVALGTATPDMFFPSTACLVSQAIGAAGAGAFDLSAACSGFLYALAIAAQFVENGRARNALAVGSEVLSKITDYTDRGSCILFGDGAGAAVVGAGEEGPAIRDVLLRAGDADRWDALCLPAGGTAMPASEETVRARKHYIQLKGREVFKLAVGRMIEVLEETFARNGLAPGGVDLLVPHQMNRRIIEATSDRIGIPMDRVMVNIERYGNTSSASIPLALDEARRMGRLKPGDTVVLVTFGGGFTWATAVLDW